MNWKGAPPRSERLCGWRVLVVEDEPLIALDLGSVLGEAGAVVVGPGRTFAQSLRLASRAKLSAALLDVRLGLEHVAPVAKALQRRGVPFAFYTGQSDTDLVHREWPAAPVIAKPTPARQLVSAVEALCRSA